MKPDVQNTKKNLDELFAPILSALQSIIDDPKNILGEISELEYRQILKKLSLQTMEDGSKKPIIDLEDGETFEERMLARNSFKNNFEVKILAFHKTEKLTPIQAIELFDLLQQDNYESLLSSIKKLNITDRSFIQSIKSIIIGIGKLIAHLKNGLLETLSSRSTTPLPLPQQNSKQSAHIKENASQLLSTQTTDYTQQKSPQTEQTPQTPAESSASPIPVAPPLPTSFTKKTTTPKENATPSDPSSNSLTSAIESEINTHQSELLSSIKDSSPNSLRHRDPSKTEIVSNTPTNDLTSLLKSAMSNRRIAVQEDEPDTEDDDEWNEETKVDPETPTSATVADKPKLKINGISSAIQAISKSIAPQESNQSMTNIMMLLDTPQAPQLKQSQIQTNSQPTTNTQKSLSQMMSKPAITQQITTRFASTNGRALPPTPPLAKPTATSSKTEKKDEKSATSASKPGSILDRANAFGPTVRSSSGNRLYP